MDDCTSHPSFVLRVILHTCTSSSFRPMAVVVISWQQRLSRVVPVVRWSTHVVVRLLLGRWRRRVRAVARQALLPGPRRRADGGRRRHVAAPLHRRLRGRRREDGRRRPRHRLRPAAGRADDAGRAVGRLERAGDRHRSLRGGGRGRRRGRRRRQRLPGEVPRRTGGQVGVSAVGGVEFFRNFKILIVRTVSNIQREQMCRNTMFLSRVLNIQYAENLVNVYMSHIKLGEVTVSDQCVA